MHTSAIFLEYSVRLNNLLWAELLIRIKASALSHGRECDCQEGLNTSTYSTVLTSVVSVCLDYSSRDLVNVTHEMQPLCKKQSL